MEHLRATELRWIPASENHFTGSVWFGQMIAGSPSLSVLGVMFEPRARTDWHRHPEGQTLYVVGGSGFVATEGGDLVAIAPGDLVAAPAGELHWHGAAPHSYLMHLSLTTGGDTQWVARPVTEEEYPGD